jgi:coiled-coil domain-containing protein 77
LFAAFLIIKIKNCIRRQQEKIWAGVCREIFLCTRARSFIFTLCSEEKERLLKRIEELKDDVDRYHGELKAAVAAATEVSRHATSGNSGRRPKTREAGTNAYLPGGRGLLFESSSDEDADETDFSGYGDGRALNGGKAGPATAAAAAASRDASLAEMYREQCLQLEDELCRLREEKSVHTELFGQK